VCFNAALSQQSNAAARHGLLAAVLQQQAAFSASSLLSWVLQRPQQLQIDELPARLSDIYTLEALLFLSSNLLKDLSGVLPDTFGSNTAQIMM
jgi:hypothetical protein